MTDEMLLVPVQENDRPYLIQLRMLTMLPHFEEAGWSLSQSEHEFRVDDDFFSSHLIQLSAKTAGMVKYTIADGGIEIMQLQVHPDFQRKGLGARVITHLLASYELDNAELTVLKANPALKLYRRLGFEQVDEDE